MLRTTPIALMVILLLATAVQAQHTSDSRAELRRAYWEGHAAGEWTADKSQEEAEAQLKSELHDLQLCLERWAIDHEVEDSDETRHWGNNYPSSLSQLMVAPCCAEHPDGKPYARQGLYPNPFAGMGAEVLNARCVPYGWSSESAGNFSYITQYNELGNVCAYVLIAWGNDPQGGYDIDGDGQPDGTVLMVAGGEPLDQHGMFRRQWTEEQREAAQLVYWDSGTAVQVLLNWPK